MNVADDNWKDSYDKWKLQAPDDDEDLEPYCFHEDFEIDWEGRAFCDQCQETWWATSKQIADQQCHEREYAEWVEEQYWREQRRSWVRRLAFWRRKPAKLTDDEIPF